MRNQRDNPSPIKTDSIKIDYNIIDNVTDIVYGQYRDYDTALRHMIDIAKHHPHLNFSIDINLDPDTDNTNYMHGYDTDDIEDEWGKLSDLNNVSLDIWDDWEGKDSMWDEEPVMITPTMALSLIRDLLHDIDDLNLVQEAIDNRRFEIQKELDLDKYYDKNDAW